MTAGLFRTADYGTLTYHGGALEVARQLAPGAPEPWIDLSTGINPHAYPLPDLEPEAWSSVARGRRACEARGRRGPALRRRRRKRGRGSRFAGAYPSPVSYTAARRGRRVGARPTAALPPPSPPRAVASSKRIGSTTWATSTSRSWSILTTPMDGSRRAPRCSIFTSALRDMRARSSSTRPSPISMRRRKASRRRCLRAAPSCCARLARLTAWPGCGSVSPWRRPTSNRRCGPRLAPGPSAARRSRSGRARSPIRIGCKERVRASAKTQPGSTLSCTGQAGESSAGRGSFDWPRMLTRAPPSSGCSTQGSLPARSRTRRIACDSGFPATRTHGAGSATALQD